MCGNGNNGEKRSNRITFFIFSPKKAAITEKKIKGKTRHGRERMKARTNKKAKEDKHTKSTGHGG